MKYQNNCRDNQKYQIAEAERQSKYQILQKRKTKYHSNFYYFFLQKLNANTKLHKLKRRRNIKTIAEIEQKYQIAEVEGKSKYQILQKQKTKYHSNFYFFILQKLNSNIKLQKLKRRRNTKTIVETEQKYQIAEADTKLQKPKRRRNTKTIAETEQKYQIAEADTKLQKPKRRRNTKTIAEIEQKYQIAEAEESIIKFQILILQPQAQNLIFILHLLIGQTTHV
jgi:hypothetical protein